MCVESVDVLEAEIQDMCGRLSAEAGAGAAAATEDEENLANLIRDLHAPIARK